MLTLDDLVRVLACQHDETHTVEDDEGRSQVTVSTEPLLATLEGSAACSSGGAGGGSQPGSRIIIDVDSIELRDRIRSELQDDLARLTGRYEYHALPALLTRWHEEFAREALAAEVAVWVEVLAGWVAEIRELFDPPKRIEIAVACFICKAAKLLTVESGEAVEKAAIVLEYRRGDEAGAVLRCRACRETLASGAKAVRETARLAGYSLADAA